MAAMLSPPSHLFLHRFLRPPPALPSRSLSSPSSLFSIFSLKHLTSIHLPSPLLCTPLTSLSSRSRPPSSPLSSVSLSSNRPSPLSPLHSLSTSQLILEPKSDDHIDEDSDSESEGEKDDGRSAKAVSNPLASARVKEPAAKLPSLTVKERKELASYAHSLGKKLKSQQVGKSGVTDSVAMSLVETLEANELLKIKIHNNCPAELDDAVKQLEEATGSVVVGQIGRTVILYRPSLTKLKAEEKKKEAQRVFRRKQRASKSSFENRGQVPRTSGRGRRGSSRFSSSS
ncbi:hypothetical protein NMG60_11014760 [Bertholletia excelsa]